MTRYNDPCAPFRDLKTEHVLDYREGVDRVLWFLEDWDDESGLIQAIRDAIKEGII